MAITISLVDQTQPVDPARRLGALRATRQRKLNIGVPETADVITDLDRQIRELLEAHPDLAAAKPSSGSTRRAAASDPATTDEARRSVGAHRAHRSRLTKAGVGEDDPRITALDARIAELIAKFPDAAEPKRRPKSDDDDGDVQVDRQLWIERYRQQKAAVDDAIAAMLLRRKQARKKAA